MIGVDWGTETPIWGAGAQGRDSNYVPQFLNRLLGLELELQSALFSWFTAAYDAELRRMKSSGDFDVGIQARPPAVLPYSFATPVSLLRWRGVYPVFVHDRNRNVSEWGDRRAD